MQFIDVLIIEDNIADQKLLSSYLHEYDMSLRIASSASDAEELLSYITFKLILLDISLPNPNASKLITLIKENMGLATPIVAIKEYCTMEMEDKCFESGISGYLNKPVERVELMAVLTQFFPLEKLSPCSSPLYTVIDFQYLKEIGLGDVDFEIEITEKFIETIYSDCSDLQDCYLSGNKVQLKVVAHRMLSTIFVMGLRPKIEHILRSIESEYLSDENLKLKLDIVFKVSEKARNEAKQFVSLLKEAKLNA